MGALKKVEKRVDAITNFKRVRAYGDDLYVEDLSY